MVVDWSVTSPFFAQMERSFNKTLARFGMGKPVSLGDIWPDFRKRYPEGSEVEFDSPEFRLFLKRRVKDQLRREGRQTRRFGILTDFDAVEPTSDLPNPSDRLIRAEQVAWVGAALSRIPEAKRGLILARLEGGAPKYAEMARGLGVSPRTIKRRAHRAWGQMLRTLDQDEQMGGDL